MNATVGTHNGVSASAYRTHIIGKLREAAGVNAFTASRAAEVVERVVTEAIDLNAFISNAIYDPYDFLVDTSSANNAWPGYGQFLPPYYFQNQKRGEDLPYYYDEIQLRFLRDRMRKLVASNPFAQCGIGNFVNYCIGKDGLKISAVAARRDCSPRLIERAQKVIDLNIEENEFGEFCKDRVAQGQINGDAVVRLFPDWDSGLVRLRGVEGEHVRSPNGASYGPEYSFGRQTLPDDVETDVGTWIVEQPILSPMPKFVPMAEVVWLKFNSPRSSKRGLPLYGRGACEFLLRAALRLITAAGSTAIQRAKIGMVRYLDGVIKDAAKSLHNELTDYTVTDPASGQMKSVQSFPDGAIINASANMKHEFPGSNFDAQVFDTAGKMILRAVAAYLNFPEFMLTADSSSGTFNNTFIAEAPSTRMFEGFQADFIRRVATNRTVQRRSIVWHWIVHAVRCGILHPDTLHCVQIQAEAPSMVIRDKSAEATMNKTYCEMGVKSIKTVQLETGLDPDQENANIAAERDAAMKRQAAMMTPAASGGGERNPDANGSDGAGGEGAGARRNGPQPPEDKAEGVTESVDASGHAHDAADGRFTGDGSGGHDDTVQRWKAMYDAAGEDSGLTHAHIGALQDALQKKSVSELKAIVAAVKVTPTNKTKMGYIVALVDRIRELKHVYDSTRPGFSGVGATESVDASGHRHKGKGKGGGQFAASGGGDNTPDAAKE